MKTPRNSEQLMPSLVQLDRSQDTPLYQQIYSELRRAILNQQLESGTKLPSTRELASLYDVSRNTIKSAFSQLITEGYLESFVGAGTFVSHQLPDDLSFAFVKPSPQFSETERHLSQRGQSLIWLGKLARAQNIYRDTNHIFVIGVPELEVFPFELWTKLSTKMQRKLSANHFGYHQDPLGYRPLREAIARYVRTSRAVRCEADQILIVSGSQQGFFTAAQALVNPNDSVWVEEPGYSGSKGVMMYLGHKIVPVPVDDEGIQVEQGIQLQADARMAIVTPSHQYPLGMTMSLPRRLQLLKWASQHESWILEDDYDSEFRYSGPPLASLQGLDHQGRVIYMGTFSKVLFPALRLSYLILPPDLVDAFVGVYLPTGNNVPLLSQAVLAEFIQEGHFSRHIRRMRKLYHQRRNHLLDALKKHLGEMIEIGPNDGGMHLNIWLPENVRVQDVTKHLEKYNAQNVALSLNYLDQHHRDGLLLGFSSATESQIETNVKELAQAIETATSA